MATFMFTVNHSKTIPGQHIYIIGSFNDWDPTTALQLHTNNDIFPTWNGEIKLEPGKYEYKPIIMDADNNIINWYPGKNLTIDLQRINYNLSEINKEIIENLTELGIQTYRLRYSRVILEW